MRQKERMRQKKRKKGKKKVSLRYVRQYLLGSLREPGAADRRSTNIPGKSILPIKKDQAHMSDPRAINKEEKKRKKKKNMTEVCQGLRLTDDREQEICFHSQLPSWSNRSPVERRVGSGGHGWIDLN